MILRVWRARLRPGVEGDFLDRLRDVVRSRALPRPTDVTFGFRQDAGRTTFVAVSIWSDEASLLEATAGDLNRTSRHVLLDDLVEDQQPGTYEDRASIERVAFPEGRVLGVVTARVKPQHEAAAQEMVDGGATGALRAGALAAHIGRRLDSEVAELAIVVVWPRREAMTRFLRSRDMPAIDPAFVAHVSSWRFETYTALDPERLIIPAVGPAVVVMDLEGRLVDSTPGVENVLGVPGELLEGRSILDLAPGPELVPDFRRRFLETGVSHGQIELRRPDGEPVRARYRSIEGVPGPGLRSIVVSLPRDPDDSRPTADIVYEALRVSETALAG